MSTDFLEFCKKCEEPCCNGFFVLSKEEQETLEQKGYGRHLDMKDGYCVIEGDPCPFYKNSHCVIHDVRPTICRIYPLYPSIDCDGKLALKIDEDCPAVKELGEEFFESAKKRALKFVNEELSLECYRKFWED